MKTYKFKLYNSKKNNIILKQMYVSGMIYNTLLDLKSNYKRHEDRPLNKDNIADKEAILYNAKIVNSIRILLYRLNISTIIKTGERDDIYRIVDTVTYYLKYNRIIAGENNELITDEYIEDIGSKISEALDPRIGKKINKYDFQKILDIVREYCNLGKDGYLSGIDLTNFLTLLKKDPRYMVYNVLPAAVAQGPAIAIAASYQLFFSNLKKNPERAGKPQFKKAKNYTFVTYRGSYKLIDNSIILSYKEALNLDDKLTIVRKHTKLYFHKDREIMGEIKQVTFTRDKIGNIYLCVVSDIEEKIYPKNSDRGSVGIQWGLNPILTLSTGMHIQLPTLYREMEDKLIIEQRKLSRKVGSKKYQRKSNNFESQRIKLARLFKKKVQLRENWEWSTAVNLCNQFKVIVIKDANLTSLQKEGQGKLLLDISIGTFLLKLKYQCEKRNVNFIVLPKDSEAETAEEILNAGLNLDKELNEKGKKKEKNT